MKAKVAPPRKLPVARTAARILRALARYDRAGATSKLLARDLDAPLRTVQFHLRRLVKDEAISEPYRGRFVFVPGTPDILADPEGAEGIHGLVIGTDRLRDDLLRMPVCARFPALERPDPGARYGETTLEWSGHLVRIRLYGSTSRLLVYVPSTRNPIAFRQFGEFVGWLSGILAPLRPEDLRVVQVGIHTDYGGWLLKGIQAIELRRFLNASEQLYQKLGVVRHEVHLNPRQLSLDQAVRIIREGSPTAQLERLLRLQVQIESGSSSRNAAQGVKTRPGTTLDPGDLHGQGYG